MSNDLPHPRSANVDQLGEDELFARLEEYTEALQAGDVLRCKELMLRFPQLEEFVGCLDLLEQFGDPESSHHSSKLNVDSPTMTSGPRRGSSGGSSLLQPNQRFGKFIIHEELGRGGMGIVFRATEPALEREVAVKVIRSHQLANEEELRRFHTEARAAARLQHPNIIGIHEFGEVDGLHYFAMEYVAGETLSDRLKRGRLEIEQAARLSLEIARAVEYLHGQSVLHRDLKPSNILIDATESPFVMDFGLARIFGTDESQQTKTGAILGTPSYMAPEQAAGRVKEIGPRTDVYSLGAILYEMLTGVPPFKEENPLDTIVKVLETEPQLPRRLRADIPGSLERICLKCLEKEPEKRYASADELADDLQRFLADEPVHAASPNLWRRARRWARRFPAVASRLAGVVAAASIFQIRYLFAGVSDVGHHIQVMTLLGLWSAVIILFQFLTRRLSRRPRVADSLEHAWSASDAFMLTILLLNAQNTGDRLGPLLVGYPMIIVSSGMFFNVRVVVSCTMFCLIGYLSLWLYHPLEPEVPLYGFIFLAVLSILGFVTAYQVHRAKVLSRFYDHPE
ncbi:MAG TPA: serine/threonine-protein kinase [Planctomycetaceae bacterium]|nr:serine/threonine-protein kinase [Planctomycetaceae bacterium]